MIRILVTAVVLGAAVIGAAQGAETVPSLTASLEPANPRFGDSFAYIAEATVPAALARDAEVVAAIGPFTRVAPSRITRSTNDGVVTITLTETLSCLTISCVPRRDGSTVQLPPARLTVGTTATVADSVAVHVRPRVTSAAVAAAKPAFVRPAELPTPASRVAPGAALFVLTIGGIALVAAGAFALASPLLRRRAHAARARKDSDEVVRAARLLRESTTRTPTDRRRAAALASRVAGGPAISADAAHLAWSRAEPVPPDAATLAERIEREHRSSSAGPS